MVLPLLTLLAAAPHVLVVSTWGETPGAPGKAPKWSGPVFAPLACTTPDAGVSAAPDCLSGVPSKATVTLLDGTTREVTGKKTANVSLSDCGANGARCDKRPLWLMAKQPVKPSKATSDDEPQPLAAEVGFWPKDLARFALTPGATDVALPGELPPLAVPRAKNPSGKGAEKTSGALLTFQVPGQAAPFQLLTIGDAFAYKAPGAAAFIWATSRRSPVPVELLAAMDLDGNGVPEVVAGRQHAEGDTEFEVFELGPSPRVLAPAP